MMRTRVGHRAIAVAVVLAIITHARGASAAGFQVSEQSITGLGRAFAGAGIVGDDASAVFYNPAAMSLLEGTQAQGGVTVILPSAVFHGSSTRAPVSLLTGAPVGPATVEQGRDGGGSDTFVPHFYFATDLTDRVKLGLGATAPFGLITDYDTHWVGRYHALRSNLRTYDFNPSLSYRINEHFSIGGGMSAQYASVSLSQAVFTGTPVDGLAKVHGTDWSYGYNAGVLFELNDRIRAGAAFRSQVKHTLGGELKVTGVGPQSHTVGAEATTSFPETVHADVFARVTDEIGLSAGMRWTNWSRFDELRVRFADGSPDSVTKENWHDSWMAKVGVDYLVLPGLTLRSGFAYDQTPVDNRSFRTPRIPDSSRYWLSVGASYRVIDRVNVDIGYAHLFSPRGDITNTIPIAQPSADTAVVDRLDGHFSSGADLVGLQALCRF